MFVPREILLLMSDCNGFFVDEKVHHQGLAIEIALEYAKFSMSIEV